MTYTTRLLSVMPVRHRVVLGAIVAFVTVGSIVGSVSSRPAVQPPIPIVIARTPRPHLTRPVQAIAPREAARPMPTATPAPTVAPLPAVVVVEATPEPIVVSQAAAPAPVIEGIHERASDKPGPPSR